MEIIELIVVWFVSMVSAGAFVESVTCDMCKKYSWPARVTVSLVVAVGWPVRIGFSLMRD